MKTNICCEQQVEGKPVYSPVWWSSFCENPERKKLCDDIRNLSNPRTVMERAEADTASHLWSALRAKSARKSNSYKALQEYYNKSLLDSKQKKLIDFQYGTPCDYHVADLMRNQFDSTLNNYDKKALDKLTEQLKNDKGNQELETQDFQAWWNDKRYPNTRSKLIWATSPEYFGLTSKEYQNVLNRVLQNIDPTTGRWRTYP